MKGDFSRRTHDPRKHYSAVLLQQGRVLTDADLEEEHRIVSGALERTAADVIGGCGGPIGGAGFAVTSPDGAGLELGAGRYYVGGMLVVNEATVAYPEQPDRFADDVAWPPGPGRYAIVLDVWRRLITALDDPAIREVALGGPATAVRERTVWQARHVPVPPDWTCAAQLPPSPATTGAMAARAEPEDPASTPCLVPPLAGYTGLENQLYRVEVLTSGAALDVASAVTLPIVGLPPATTNQVQLSPADAGGLAVGDVVEVVRMGPGVDPIDATFAQVAAVDGAVVTLTSQVPAVAPGEAAALRLAPGSVVVSRENGSVVTSITGIDGAEVTVADLGPDDVLGFAPGQWVELSDDRTELEHRPRQLRQIASIDTDRLVVTLRTPADPLAATATGVAADRHPKLRRWDGARAIVFRPDGTGWIHVENGIQVRFAAGGYVSGDYWHFPARAAVVDPASGNIEWPQDSGAAAELPPFGVAHHVCPLAVVEVAPGPDGSPQVTLVGDCRDLFPPVTELTTLLHVGGDGQEARPGGPGFPELPAPLSVRVANGSHPVAGARVAFTGPGQLIPAAATTDADGLLTCTWRLDPGFAAQSCEAHLLDAAGVPVPHQVVRFNATVEAPAGPAGRGCCVCVGPGAQFESIEEAIKGLLDQGERDLCLCLTVGDHVVGQLELPEPDREGPRFHLAVKGCGRGTRVLVKGGLLVDGWASVHLAGLSMALDREARLLTRGVGEVSLADVHIRGNAGDLALVRIHDATRVHVDRCVIRAGRAAEGSRLRDLFADLGALVEIWDQVDEPELDLLVRKVARAVAGMPVDDRRRGAALMLRKARDAQLGLSAGLLARLGHLAAVLSSDLEFGDLTETIQGIIATLATQSDLVALEVGAGDDRQERMDDPAGATPAEIIVEGTEVYGNISFYGRAGGVPLNVDERARLAELLKGGARFSGLAGNVHLRDNRFGRLLVSAGMLRALRQLIQGNIKVVATAYATFLASGNVVDGTDGQVLAQHVALSGNDFTLAARSRPAPPLVVLDATMDTGVATGNHGDSLVTAAGALQPVAIEVTARMFTEAANLELAFT